MVQTGSKQNKTDSVTVRVFSGVLAVLVFPVALAGLAAWGVAKSYFIEDQPHFHLVLFVSILSFLVDAYCVFTAIIGYRLIDTRINYIFLIVIATALIPTSIFVAKFFV